MKRYLLSGLLMLAVTFSFAKKIDTETAKTIGKAFYYEQLERNDRGVSLDAVKVTDIHTMKASTGEDAIYILNMEPQGFILVSGDDVFRPVLGYSLERSYNPEQVNHNFESWVGNYVAEYEDCKAEGMTDNPEFANLWTKYNTTDASTLEITRSPRAIEPLLNPIWNQDYPYNMSCPEDSDGPGGHVYAGCVATAMSMIMYYYRYPEHGTGTSSYYASGYGTLSVNYGETYWEWDAMQDHLTSTDIVTFDSKKAVADLQYHCGVSVNMMYAADGSGAYSVNVPDAIQDHFNYDASSTYQSRNTVANWAAWMNILREQLDAQQPLYYSGSGTDGGHAFCCDAYDDNDMFHFNFGWSGYNNGFYALTGSNAVGGFYQSQAIVKNFIPDQSSYPTSCDGHKDMTYLSGSITDNSGPIAPYAADSDCSWLISPKSEFDSIQKIKIRFRELDLEADADYVRIYAGTSTSDELVGEYTGSTLPDDITVENDNALITFVSDANETENEGFRLEYKSYSPSYCSGMTQLTDATGTLSDGSNDKYYAANSSCQFFIQPSNANTITLEFNEFDLADEGDFIQVQQVNPSQVLGEFTAGDTPGTITSNGNGMFVVFKTNDTEFAQGFEAEYTIDVAVGNTDAFDKLNIYPNPAKTELNISFEAQSVKNANVKVIDLTGKVVYSEDINAYGNTYSTSIPVGDYAKGIYFVNIVSDKGSVREKVVIK